MSDTEQFWSGEFGADYTRRSPGDPEANYHFFARALAHAYLPYPPRILELGCGTGANLKALRRHFPHATLTGVEINRDAIAQIPEDVEVNRCSVLDWLNVEEWDLVLSKGFLIHVAPADLPKAYETIYDASRKYILLAEYFSPRIEEVEYRGNMGVLWKGPHAYQMMDRYQNLRLVDYGFVSKRDVHPQDDIHWWILQKE